MSTNPNPGAALAAAITEAIQTAEAADLPRLVLVTEEEDGIVVDRYLKCPVCEGRIYEDELYAVSWDQNWCPFEEVREDYVKLNSDIDRDLGDTVYFIHGDGPEPCYVRLPEGFTEEYL